MTMAVAEGAMMEEAELLLRRIGADAELHRRFMAMLEDLHEGEDDLAKAARQIGRCDRRRFSQLKLAEHHLYEKLLTGFANALATMPSGIETALGVAAQVLPH
jgi:hypothetical protein